MAIIPILNLKGGVAKTVTTEPEMPTQPSTFTAKYTAPFAKLFESLCDEIVKRSQWEPSETVAKSAAVAGKPARA